MYNIKKVFTRCSSHINIPFATCKYKLKENIHVYISLKGLHTTEHSFNQLTLPPLSTTICIHTRQQQHHHHQPHPAAHNAQGIYLYNRQGPATMANTIVHPGFGRGFFFISMLNNWNRQQAVLQRAIRMIYYHCSCEITCNCTCTYRKRWIYSHSLKTKYEKRGIKIYIVKTWITIY